MNRLDYLIDYLLKEDPQYSEMQVPSDLQGKRDLFRALRNVRWPKPVSEDFLRLQDEELQEQLMEKGVVELNACRDGVHTVSTNKQLLIWQGDITRLKVDAIVNAANSQMLGCFHPLHKCIDNAIHSAAGVQLREECHQLMLQQGHEESTGQAKITKAYNLPCKYELADENHLDSVAFCCISTGEFRFPNQLAAEIAVQTVKDYLTEHPDSSIKQVVFNVFKDIDRDFYQRLL